MVELYVGRELTCDPVVNILGAVRQELAAQLAAAHGIEAEQESNENGTQYKIRGTIAQISDILSKLYVLGQTGFRVDVETDEEQMALGGHCGVGELNRGGLRMGDVIRLSAK